jgi:hypothetical protein
VINQQFPITRHLPMKALYRFGGLRLGFHHDITIHQGLFESVSYDSRPYYCSERHEQLFQVL